MVAALWGLAALWISIGPFTGDHSNATSRWMQNVALLLISAASTTLVVWLVQYLVIKPQNTERRTFELGYYAGRADALDEVRMLDGSRTPLWLVTSANGSTGHAGM